MIKSAFDTFSRPVAQKLSQLERSGIRIKLWWRDDDCVEPTSALEKLINSTTGCDIPLGLAVIPKHCDISLGMELKGINRISVLQHGYEHQNYSGIGQKKCEFPMTRSILESQRQMERGKKDLESLFGDQFLPVFVPPWNRLPAEFETKLKHTGYCGLSQYGLNRSRFQVNTHFDFIDWKAKGRLLPLDKSAPIFCELLDHASVEPLGVLSHHLIHDDEIWSFVDRFVALLSQFSNIEWVHPTKLVHV